MQYLSFSPCYFWIRAYESKADPGGTQPIEIYNARAVFYSIVTLDQLTPDTVLKASWVSFETSRLTQNSVIKIDEIVPTSSTSVFKFQNKVNF